MPLKIKTDNEIDMEISCSYLEDEKVFEIYGEQDGIVFNQIIDYILPVHSDFNINEYLLFTITSDQLYENDIYRLKVDNKDHAVGWTFPIQALLSAEHDNSANPFFLRYAYVAFLKLVNGDGEVKSKSPQYREGYKYSLLDFYEQNLAIIVICKKYFENEEFLITNYLPSLYEKINLDKPANEFLKIDSVSENLRGDSFITKLFDQLLLIEKHHLLKFMLLYQLVELFIEKILKKEVSTYVRELQEGGIGIEYFEFKTKFNKLSEESVRLGKLFSSSYTRPQRTQERGELKDQCNILLQKVGKEEKTNETDALYSVRSLLVHSYRSVSEENIPILEEINRLFEIVIIDIINNYAEPV